MNQQVAKQLRQQANDYAIPRGLDPKRFYKILKRKYKEQNNGRG
jgi:hypothetical protein